jgi:hypothetical protein
MIGENVGYRIPCGEVIFKEISGNALILTSKFLLIRVAADTMVVEWGWPI